MIRLLLDEGLPRSTVTALTGAGRDIIHVYDIGLGRATDSEILEYAREEKPVCVTVDADLHALLAASDSNRPLAKSDLAT